MFSDEKLKSKVVRKQPIPSDAERVFSGLNFSIFQWDQQLYDGSIQKFEKASRSDAAGIVPITTEGKIILAEQEQPGISLFTGLVGGVVDPGEKIFDTAKRELLEECGCVAQDWKLWFATQPVTRLEWNVFIFIALGCEQVQDQQLDAGEKIKLREVTFDEFIIEATKDNFRDIEVALRIMKELYSDPELRELKKLFEL